MRSPDSLPCGPVSDHGNTLPHTAHPAPVPEPAIALTAAAVPAEAACTKQRDSTSSPRWLALRKAIAALDIVIVAVAALALIIMGVIFPRVAAPLGSGVALLTAAVQIIRHRRRTRSRRKT